MRVDKLAQRLCVLRRRRKRLAELMGILGFARRGVVGGPGCGCGFLGCAVGTEVCDGGREVLLVGNGRLVGGCRLRQTIGAPGFLRFCFAFW